MDACLNDPFREILRKCWIKYVSSVVESFPQIIHSRFKLWMLTHQKVIDWVKEGFDHLVESPEEMVKSSFEVCGISSSYPLKVSCDSFYQAYMEGALAYGRCVS